MPYLPRSTFNSTTRLAADQQGLRAAIVRTACMLTIGGAAALMALSLTACRTTEGAGKDLSKLGDNIADSADKHKP